MLTSKLTLHQLAKAHEHYKFQKRLDKAFLAIPSNKVSDVKRFFERLKALWDNEDKVVIAWFSKRIEPALKDAFEYFLTKLNS